MKKFILIFLLFGFIIGCKKGKEQEPILEITQSSINFSSSGGNQAITVTSNIDWNASLSGGEWATINPSTASGNGKINVIASENTTVGARNMTMTVTAQNFVKTVTLSQEGASATLNISKTNENVNSISGSFAVEVTTNGASWTSSGVPNWITLSPANGTSSGQLTISYQSNTLAVSRNATITFTSGSSSKTLTITQAAATATLNLDKTSENVNSAAGSFAVEVTTNGASWTTSGVPNWITLSPANGSTSGQVTISFQSNTLAVSRNATITFTSGTSSKSLTITQAAATATLNLDKTNENVNSAVGSFAVEVTTNGASWTSSGVPNWIILSPANGSSSGQVTISYQSNILAVSRNATITFTSGTSSKTLTITQAAATATLNIDKTSENVNSISGSVAVEVTTNGAGWTTSGVPNWITLSPTNGTSSGQVTISYQSNTLAVSRNATVTFTSGSSLKTLTITQAAATATLNLDKTNENVNSISGSFAVEVTTNGASWTTGGVPNWITLNPVNGSTSGQVNISYQSNTLAATRNTTITFTSGTSSKSLTITQAAATATLNLDKTNENVNSILGSFVVEVTTNGASWTSNGVPNWITLSPANGSTSGQVTISYQSNTLAVSRNATVTFTSGSSLKTLTITQAAATATLNIDKTNENINSSSGNFVVEVTTNGASWTSSGVPNWITLSPANGSSSGQVTISYQSNAQAVSRNATITFTSGTSSKSLTITQAAATATLNLDKTNENVNSAVGSFAVEVTTNGASWTSSGVPNWIILSPANGSSSGQVTISYQSNSLAVSRNATVTFTSGSSLKTLTITQAAATAVLKINISKKQVGYQAGSVLVELTTNNAEWKITGLPAWISANPLQGDKSGTITLNYQANNLKEKRSAQIVFSAGNISQSLFFEQLTSIDANDGGNW